ncbi:MULTISPECIES: OmpA family protein [unclassified Mucilaginibacter]|uniref:OmpA family protein n=1 Tax=unclassified Mucilaginibacter TaxID=2617802 RepID=UPI002AC9853A|nr:MULTISPECIES: OmpA family protein [unclassified Mucilaginibacter]MEB0249333.1 OmpA family protein [Mucilaginibacter sp. 5B2]MEB0263628.1 OmpA family protein [Mucilaginibacter sp. 10I4]MEB0280209.1 OmpA family protein [Mucilaginibacter sp. 10B2]MEB0301168.1 OmpA family protein [Mucilaginibacter sp. 5C4]WPX24382.1 OmpA family protein [Mucilaginibacter sp. 5C4]
MNYSTLKKSVALSFASLLVAGMVSAQTDSTKTVTTKTMADTTMSSTVTTAKVFGGRGQYKTWSIGLNVGATSQVLATGGGNDFRNKNIELGYGISVRDQLGHNFGLQLDVRGGKVSGDNSSIAGNPGMYSTKFYQATLSGVVNVATIDFIRRKNSVNFFINAGAGLAMYNPTGVTSAGVPFNYKDGVAGGAPGIDRYVREFVVPVGVGVKFRLSDVVALNFGYTQNFIDGGNFDGVKNARNSKDHYSYGYGGLEFTLGSKSKPSLEWVNPVAMMYDELYDAALRQEVEALKGRVTNVENAVTDLKKDSDGDGVSDQFDKCPNTPAGSVVDGSGCVIVFPKADSAVAASTAAAYSNIQFEFDSSVLRTSSYPVLDATSADLRSSGKTVEIDGYASSEGTAAHNLSLSRDRANSVKTYLVNSGVAASKLKVKGYGETNPIADNSTEEGRVANRRVAFKQR